jgi:hypothetical protein
MWENGEGLERPASFSEDEIWNLFQRKWPCIWMGRKRNSFITEMLQRDRFMTRLIITSVVLLLLVCVSEHADCGTDDLDSVAQRQAQLYLDSLNTIFRLIEEDVPLARQRMHAFLDSWVKLDRTWMASHPPDDTARLCDEVFAYLFEPKMQRWKVIPPQFPELGTSMGRYVVLPDSIEFTLVNHGSVWDSLMKGAEEERTGGLSMVFWEAWENLAFGKWRPRLTTGRTVLYMAADRYVALKAFLYNHDVIPSGREDGRYSEKRFEWIESFFPICPGHWGPYFFMATMPNIDQLVFAPQKDTVIVRTRTGCFSGSSGIHHRTDDSWKLMQGITGWYE